MIGRVGPRVALLHYTAPPIIGGVEATIAIHAGMLTDYSYSVKVIAGRGGKFDDRVPTEIIPLIDSRHPDVTAVNQELAMGSITSNYYSLVAAIRRELEHALVNIDICIVHNALTLHKNLALTTALYEINQVQRLSVIGWCHDLAWLDPVYAKEIYNGLPWNLLKQAWIGVNYVVTSEASRKELACLLRISEADITIVHLGIDACDFLGVTQITAKWVHEMNLLSAAPLLLMPVRVTRRKNIELAIEILGALSSRGSSAQLVVMGPLGPHNPANISYLDELYKLRRERNAGDVVTFLLEYGPVSDVIRRDLYFLADAILLTSLREGFGIPILEAGIARLPIFCSDIPPFRESAEEWAYYFALDDSPVTIADHIIEFFKNDGRYQLKQRLLREYTWERIFEERIEPLLRLISM